MNLQYKTHDLTRAAAIEFDNWKTKGKFYPNLLHDSLFWQLNMAKPQNKKSKSFNSEFLTNWPPKSSIVPINLREKILKPDLNFMMLFMMTSRTRNILTNCGKTPA
jgi:hypothetical protein